MINKLIAIFTGAALVAGAGSVYAVTYTSDPNLGNVTAGVTEYATFTSFCCSDPAVSAPFTPTTATVNAGNRVYGFGSAAVSAQFSSAVSQIRVFANIDHFGASYDGFQYSISGSNDGVTYTPLFDALTVNGAGEPFTLGSFTGTAPSTVNNVLTPGAGPGGTVGYIADFTFANPYKFYLFGASTVAVISGNTEPEFSAVGAIPEPTSWAMLLAGLGLTGLALQRRHAR
jgi:hypothetical protein